MNDVNTIILNKIRQEAESYLNPIGFSFEYFEKDVPDSYVVGEYEARSSFSGTICVYVNIDEIASIDLDLGDEDLFEQDVRITVFHEIGHGLFEFVNALPEHLIEPYFKDFFDIFFDDNGISEEDITEDFGRSFDETQTSDSLLRGLIIRMLEDKVLPYEPQEI